MDASYARLKRTFIENLYRNLVSFANTSNDVLLWDSQIVEIEGTSRTRSDAQLLLFLCNLDAHILCRYEASDTLVTQAVVDIGEYQEDFSFIAVCDPPVGA